ncbi:hypothetical protein APA386B_1985 [Acetobacter pasteurianus 386B]|nr:hypothetical protein APA386B_1985 [Acetobacter pasteurianus 386B]
MGADTGCARACFARYGLRIYGPKNHPQNRFITAENRRNLTAI